MMTKPSITELDRSVDSRYTLVAMAAKRARMIGHERMEKEEAEGYTGMPEKPVTQAVNEIAGGIVGYVRSAAIERAREYEEEKFMAISKLEKDSAAESSKDDNAEAKTGADGGDLFGDDAEYSAIDEALKLAREKSAGEKNEE